MLKTSYILLIATLAMALGLAALFTAPRQNPDYIGSSACGACHSSLASGAAQIEWQAGPHADAFISLSSPGARQVLEDRANDISSCLPCHSTISHAPIGERQERIQSEGVGCERCHGPGSEYSQSAVMRKDGGMIPLGGTPGTLSECGSCHVTVGNDTGPICPVDSSEIDPVAAWKQIGHSRDTTLFAEPSWDSIVRPNTETTEEQSREPEGDSR